MLIKKILLIVIVLTGLAGSFVIASTLNNVIQNSDQIPKIQLDDNLIPTATKDPVDIIEASISENILSISVKFSGGCTEHQFSLIGGQLFMESAPVKFGAILSHNANGDVCEALIHKTLNFDLTPLKEFYHQSYPMDSENTILICLEGYNNTITYSF